VYGTEACKKTFTRMTHFSNDMKERRARKILLNFFLCHVKAKTLIYMAKEFARVAGHLLYDSSKAPLDEICKLVNQPLVIGVTRKIIIRLFYMEMIKRPAVAEPGDSGTWSPKLPQGECGCTKRMSTQTLIPKFSFSDTSIFLSAALTRRDISASFQYISAFELNIKRDGDVMLAAFTWLLRSIIDGENIYQKFSWISRGFIQTVRMYVANRGHLNSVHFQGYIAESFEKLKLLREWLLHHSDTSYIEGKVHEKISLTATQVEREISTLKLFCHQRHMNNGKGGLQLTSMISAAPFANRMSLMHSMITEGVDFCYEFYSEHSPIYSAVMNRVDEVMESIFWNIFEDPMCPRRLKFTSVFKLVMIIYQNLKHCCEAQWHRILLDRVFQAPNLAQELSTAPDIVSHGCLIVKKVVPTLCVCLSAMGFDQEVDRVLEELEYHGINTIPWLRNLHAWSMRLVLHHRRHVIAREFQKIQGSLVNEKKRYLISKSVLWETHYPLTRQWMGTLSNGASLKCELARYIVQSNTLSTLLEPLLCDHHRVVEIALRFHLIVRIAIIIYAIEGALGKEESLPVTKPFLEQVTVRLAYRESNVANDFSNIVISIILLLFLLHWYEFLRICYGQFP